MGDSCGKVDAPVVTNPSTGVVCTPSSFTFSDFTITDGRSKNITGDVVIDGVQMPFYIEVPSYTTTTAAASIVRQIMGGFSSLGGNETAMFNWLKNYSGYDVTTLNDPIIDGLSNAPSNSTLSIIKNPATKTTVEAMVAQNTLNPQDWDVIYLTDVMNNGQDIVIHACSNQ